MQRKEREGRKERKEKIDFVVFRFALFASFALFAVHFIRVHSCRFVQIRVPHLFVLLVALASVAGGCATSNPERATVVWISIDGLRPDYLDRAKTPLLNRLVREGASTRKLIPPTPSLTFTSHVTQATGVGVAHHGIPGNAFYDTATKQRYNFPHEGAMLQAEPIWLTAKRQGVRVLVHDWPLAHAQTGPVRADYFLPKFDPAPTDEQRLDRVLETWRSDGGGDGSGEPLRLIMGYVKDPDVVGHRHGPDAPETLAAVAATDALLQHFVDDAIAQFRKQRRRRDEALYVVFTSDHGMATATTSINLDKLIDRPLPRDIVRVNSAAFVMLYLDPVPEAERDARKAALLRDLKRWDFISVYTRETLPPRWQLAHPTRVGDIVVLAKPDHAFSNRLPLATFLSEKVGSQSGVHGYSPEESREMNALCVIWRYPERMKRRELGKVPAERMHAIVAQLLNVEPAAGVRAAPRSIR
jgi:predicted AlkP superfamily pyrophosphatase or phosphodiesterase